MTTMASSLSAIYAQGEPAIRSVRSPLAAEVWASQLLGLVRLAVPEPTAAEQEETVAAFTLDLAAEVERAGDASALAALRALAAVSAAPVRAQVDVLADRLVAAGIKDRAWAATVGRPTVGRCVQHRDAATRQQTVIAEFRYDRACHALVVLIDHELGGGIKDTWVADDADALLAKVRHAPAAGLVVEDLDWPTVRRLWAVALTAPDCPREADQKQDVPMHRALLLARLALDATDAPA